MQEYLKQQLNTAVSLLVKEGILPKSDIHVYIERTRDKRHGDFACNIALTLAKIAGCQPRDLAEKIIAKLPALDQVLKVEIASPGFINFFLTEKTTQVVIHDILHAGDNYGRLDIGHGQRVILEFVSANPTGPLHVGHGRGAAYGATVANLLEAVGYKVHREYYVNDTGRQMHVLAVSVWLRYLESRGEKITFPAAGYKGSYVIDIAKQLYQEYGDVFFRPWANVMESLPADENQHGDKEEYIDALVERAKVVLGVSDYQRVFDAGLHTVLKDIQQDLEEFGVTFQQWFLESHLYETGDVQRRLNELKKAGHVYKKDGALWFRATAFGDDKDRVVVRENGQTTYFASDISYHCHKYARGFDKIIDIFGADHHGYAPRVKAFLKAEGLDPDKFEVLLVQFAVLYRGDKKVQMSTRGGEFVTLRELREEVGKDAARYFYIMRKNEQHLDFDLELAKSQSANNPVYYVQYAYARICSVFRQLKEKSFIMDRKAGEEHLSLLKEPQEKDLLTCLSRYPEVIKMAATHYEPHLLTYYLQELANALHTYYNAHQFLVEDNHLRNARLCLIAAVSQVLVNGLTLLGVSTPEIM